MGRTRPQPKGYDFQGGSDDFGFLRTLDGHISSDRFASGEDTDCNEFSNRNANKDRYVVGHEDDD